MADKKRKFANKAKTILGDPEKKPSGIGDFLEEDDQAADQGKEAARKAGDTDNRNSVQPKTAREEFRLPYELSERLRKYAFENRTTKTAAVVEALEKFLPEG